MDFKTGHFEADGNAVNIILGFVPDSLILIFDKPLVALYDACRIGYWNHSSYNRAVAAAGMYGWYTGHDNLVENAQPWTGTEGVIPYDASGEYVLITSPIPERGEIPTVLNTATTLANWAALTPVGRTALLIGTIVRPSVRNGYVYECTTGGAGAVSEPAVWPTTPGLTVQDGSAANVWTCRVEDIARDGGKGFTLKAGSSVNDEWVTFMAFRGDRDNDLGDADEGDLCVI